MKKDQETPRRHPGNTQCVLRRHPGGTQEAPKRHPVGTQEAPIGTNGSREDFQRKCAKIIVFYSINGRDRAFRVDGSDVTLTVPAACAQKRASARRAQNAVGGKAPYPTP